MKQSWNKYKMSLGMHNGLKQHMQSYFDIINGDIFFKKKREKEKKKNKNKKKKKGINSMHFHAFLSTILHPLKHTYTKKRGEKREYGVQKEKPRQRKERERRRISSLHILSYIKPFSYGGHSSLNIRGCSANYPLKVFFFFFSCIQKHYLPPSN